MTSQVFDIRTYPFNTTDKLLIDTNVWLHIYADKTNPSTKTKIYTQAFEKMLDAKSIIFIDVIIFSEFISNYTRLRHTKTEKKFKDFRNSNDFSIIAKEVSLAAKDLLKHCQRINNHFESLNIETLLTDFESHAVDFKDQLIASVCKEYQLILVTDDNDFKKMGCTIITANF